MVEYQYLATVPRDGGIFFAPHTATLPPLTAHEVRIEVAYAGVNRADLYQAEGRYAPPPGVTDVLGLEVSGVITAIGAEVRSLKLGDHVCALLTGGGYATQVQVAEWRVLPIPLGFSLQHAACLPEALFTSYLNLMELGQLSPGQRVLIHGGASGVGVMAVQLAKQFGAEVYCTVGSPEKAALCTQLGASMAIQYRTQDFESVIADTTRGEGVHLILDMVGGDYISKNLRALAQGGTLLQIAFIEAAKAQVNLAPLLTRNLKMMGSTLRSQPEEKIYALAQSLRNMVWPWLESSQIQVVLDSIVPWQDAADAHARLRHFQHAGKVVLLL